MQMENLKNIFQKCPEIFHFQILLGFSTLCYPKNTNCYCFLILNEALLSRTLKDLEVQQ